MYVLYIAAWGLTHPQMRELSLGMRLTCMSTGKLTLVINAQHCHYVYSAVWKLHEMCICHQFILCYVSIHPLILLQESLTPPRSPVVIRAGHAPLPRPNRPAASPCSTHHSTRKRPFTELAAQTLPSTQTAFSPVYRQLIASRWLCYVYVILLPVINFIMCNWC